VKTVGTALGHQFDLATAAAAFAALGLVVTARNSLNRHRSARCHGGESLARAWSFASDTINRDVALVSTRSGNGTHSIGRTGAEVVSYRARCKPISAAAQFEAE